MQFKIQIVSISHRMFSDVERILIRVRQKSDWQKPCHLVQTIHILLLHCRLSQVFKFFWIDNRLLRQIPLLVLSLTFFGFFNFLNSSFFGVYDAVKTAFVKIFLLLAVNLEISMTSKGIEVAW